MIPLKILSSNIRLAYNTVDKTSIFIVPRSSTAWRGNEAGWITTSGWAAAGQEVWGESLVATTDGIFSPQQSMLFPITPGGNNTSKPINTTIRKFIPEFIITGYKDWKLKQSKPAVWPIELSNELADKQVMMVWERHDLFPGPGRRLANKLKVPLVKSVEAAVVWEARKWGVKRPLWGNWLEKYVEASSLIEADLVSCVSEEVKEKIISLGVPDGRVIVSPNRVDSSVFHPNVDGNEIGQKYNLGNKRIIGWTGSFRAFHGLDTVLYAFEKLHCLYPDTVLMLVGDGMEFEKIKTLAYKLNLTDHVILPGRQSFTTVPYFLANFTIALVSAGSAEGFHYSPLKLREYLALGKAVIAPNAGNLSQLFKHGKDLLLYEAGDAEDLAEKMSLLLEHKELRMSLESNAKALFKLDGTWVHELKKVCDILKINY